MSCRYYSRPRLVSRLLEERTVARFIVAPLGYGKTSLALEYAESMLMMNRVSWINCKSPCFMRDLDAQDLVCATFTDRSAVKLVVFEDVPYLDDARARVLSAEVDRLLESGIEVLVTCIPPHDTLARLQQDRVTVGACDLLLDVEELASTPDAIPDWIKKQAQTTPSCRVPALAWGQTRTAPRDFLFHSSRETMPPGLLFVFVCTAAMGSGAYERLAALGHIDKDLVKQSANNYPHLGFSEDSAVFEAPLFELGDVAFALRGINDTVVKQSVFDTRDGLAIGLANAVLSTGGHGRACDIMAALCSDKACAPWIVENARQIIRACCFLPLLHLTQSIRLARLAGAERWSIVVLEAVCLHVLGNFDEACKSAKQCAFEQQASNSIRAIASVILVDDDTTTVAEHAVEALALLAENAGPATLGGDESQFQLLAHARLVVDESAAKLAAYWYEAHEDGAGEDVLAVVAAWYYDALAAEMPAGGEPVSVPCMRDDAEIEGFVRELLATASESPLDFFSASCGLALQQARMKGLALHGDPLPTATLVALRNVELNIKEQRDRYELEMAQQAFMREEWLATHPDEALAMRTGNAPSVARLRVPQLNIQVFGHLELCIGNQMVDPDLLQRRHVRSLIVLLAARQGREVSRDALCKAMWPNSSLACSKKNFYSVWSRLRRALTLPDGSCPYLVRHRAGCSFDPTIVHSDIARLDTICRTILFEEPQPEQWSEFLSEIDRDFLVEMLPSEYSNQLVVRMREEYRTKLIDALLVVANHMLSEGDIRRAIWCAQMAIEQDETREDAYMALMRVQCEAGQRTAAMATFQECRRILSVKLGIDPSPEMMQLYQRLLDSDVD